MLQRRSSTADSFECSLLAAYVRDDGSRTPVPAILRFDKADPYAVRITLDATEDRSVTWTFARQLLAAGSRRPTGVGDVRVQPDFRGGRRILTLTLTSPSGQENLELPQARVASFLFDTFAAVPPGLEHDVIDWEAELTELRGNDPV